MSSIFKTWDCAIFQTKFQAWPKFPSIAGPNRYSNLNQPELMSSDRDLHTFTTFHNSVVSQATTVQEIFSYALGILRTAQKALREQQSAQSFTFVAPRVDLTVLEALEVHRQTVHEAFGT